MHRSSLVFAAFLACWPSLAPAQPIPGDPMPHLGDEVSWLHGSPAPRFEAGTVYVLDFWATWCPPCYPMIDRLTTVADAYEEAKVVVVGIALGTEVGMPLDRFLDEEKHRIGYTIARPRDEDQLKRRLFHPAFADADDFFLPTLVIVDRQGRLVWLSDPADPEHGFERALATVAAGKHDLASTVREARARIATWAGKAERLAPVRELRAGGDLIGAAEHLLPLVKEMPEVFAPEAADVFVELICGGKEDDAYSFAVALLEQASLARVPELVLMNRAILFAARDGYRDLELAERIARLALHERGGRHPDFLYGLAKVAYARGDRTQTESWRTQAVRAAEEQGWDDQYLYVVGSLPLEVVMAQQARELRQRCNAFSE